MTIHDVAGRKVATVVDGEVSAGELSYMWKGQEDSGDDVRSGIYFARLQAGGHSATRKMVLLR